MINGNGGGIYNEGTLILQNGSAVLNNMATGNGGGIYNSPTGDLQLVNVPINNNTAGDTGGGIYNEGTISTISGGCLSGNKAVNSNELHSITSVTATDVWWGHEAGPSDLAINSSVSVQNPAATPTSDCQSYTCPGLEQIYFVDGSNLTEDARDPIKFWLVDQTSSEKREACYRLFEDVISLVMFKELGVDAFHFTANTWDVDLEYVQANQNEIALIANAPEFAAAPITPSAYYMYARVKLNGIENEASDRTDPMSYLGANFNTAMSDESIYDGSVFCDSRSDLIVSPPPRESGQEFRSYCSNLRYWTAMVNNLTDNSSEFPVFVPAYEAYLPHVRQAIFDHTRGRFDPTRSALGARPVNRTWTVASDNLDGPLAGQTPWQFQTNVNSIITYDWQVVGNEAYPVSPDIFTPTGGTQQVPSLVVSVGCSPTPSESIAEAYMRHLKLIYSNSTFTNDILPQNQRSPYYFDEDQIRFGINEDQPFSVYSHSFVSGLPDGQASTIWLTHHFTSKSQDGDPIPSPFRPETARPVQTLTTGSTEFVAMVNGQPVEVRNCP